MNQFSMLGQPKLEKLYNSITLDTFPHSLLLIGDRGCGKHLLVKNIVSKLDLPMIELDNKITQETVDNIILNPIVSVYLFNVDGVLPKFQNNLLRIVEEPPKNAYFILCGESTATILPTLLNRCIVWYFEGYSKDILSQFIKADFQDREILLTLAQTPGQILRYQEYSFKEAFDLADNMISRIGKASLANALTISDKIGFKDEKDKIELSFFLRVLITRLVNVIKINSSNYLLDMYQELVTLGTNLNFSISKQRTFENFIIRFRRIMSNALARSEESSN